MPAARRIAHRRAQRTTRWITLATAFACLGSLRCGGADVVPRVDLSESLPVQRDFSALRDRWEHADWDAVVAMAPKLDKHIQKHPGDPSTRTIRAMRAVVAVEKGEIAEAKKQLDVLASVDGEGSTRDMANVVLGSLEARSGRPQRALEQMGGQFNKIIDPPTRAFLNRELVRAALGARKLDDAARYLRALVRQSGGPLRTFAERETAVLLAKLPATVALAALKEEVAAEEPDRWFSMALAEHVALGVERDQEPKLARELLDVAAPLLGHRAEMVARVAAKGAGVRLERNTVGLLMPLRTDDLRRRGIEAASGLALALGIPGGATKLIVRDDQRDVAHVDETLALLNADGAAVIIAGFDTRESDIALAYAERTNVPIVLFRPPSRPVAADGPVFVLGESPSAVRQELVRSLANRGKKRVAMLVEERTVNDLAQDAAKLVVAEQPCGASLDFAKSAGADALVIDAGARCTNDATKAAGALTLGFGLDAARPESSAGVLAASGIFPISSGPTPDVHLKTFRDREKRDPSWWVALGHDAGLLVKDAVLGLPSEDDTADAAVAVRKRLVTDSIAKTEGSLWTTSSKGFDGARTMKRSIGVIDRKR